MTDIISVSSKPYPKDWVNIFFLTLTPIMGVPVLAWYTYRTGFELWMPGLFLVLYAFVGLSICAGYHRYFAHKSYECSRSVQIFYALFGAMAMQNSILRWSSGHRMHHLHVDSDWDPYSIRRGFWWAHVLWIFHKDPDEDDLKNVEDLKRNPIVRWQHRWDKVLLFAGGFGIPLLVGWMFGNALAGLLWGGFLRIVVIHHSTFFVNSLAHYFGSRTYDATSSARDNWAVALLTLGEGYHSFHHRFPGDFRNGIRWFHWDPAKWFIRGLRLLGMASSLRATEPPLIEKARMKAVVDRLEVRMADMVPRRGAEIRAHIDRARESFDAAIALWRKEQEIRMQGMVNRLKVIRRAYRIRLQTARREWRAALQLMRMNGLDARSLMMNESPL